MFKWMTLMQGKLEFNVYSVELLWQNVIIQDSNAFNIESND